jgi:AraC-like DNA-binding protein
VAGLAANLRLLIGFAEKGGADHAWISRTSDQLVTALRELEAHRRGDFDPRAQRSIQIAQRIAKARDAGTSVEQLCERFGKSRSQIYRLLEKVA